MRRQRIVVLGTMASSSFVGVAWQHIQYVVPSTFKPAFEAARLVARVRWMGKRDLGAEDFAHRFKDTIAENLL